MSATELHRMANEKITVLHADTLRQLVQLQYRPANGATIQGSAGSTVGSGVLPAVTAEEIGIQAAELNAYRRGLADAAAALDVALKQIVSPELIEGKEPDQANGHDGGRPNAPIYG